LRTPSILNRLGVKAASGDPLPELSAERSALDARLTALETAVKYLESALEGVQDAVHRRSRLEDQRNDELLRRTAEDPDHRPPQQP
jgi:uncharacterized coiled-coil protein SlyX